MFLIPNINYFTRKYYNQTITNPIMKNSRLWRYLGHIGKYGKLYSKPCNSQKGYLDSCLVDVYTNIKRFGYKNLTTHSFSNAYLLTHRGSTTLNQRHVEIGFIINIHIMKICIRHEGNFIESKFKIKTIPFQRTDLTITLSQL